MNLIQLLTRENSNLIIFFRFFFNPIQSILFCKFFSKVLNINYCKKNLLLFLLVMTTIGGASIFIQNSLLTDIINIMSFILSMILIFHQNIKNAFIALVCTYLSAFITEYSALCIMSNFLRCDFNTLLKLPLYFFSSTSLSYLLFIVIIVLLNFIKERKFQAIYKQHFSLKTIIITNLILGIFTMVLESYLLSVYKETIPFDLTLVIICSLVMYFLISMLSIVRTNTLEKTETDLQNEIIYNKTLTLLHDNIRGFKHDFNNIVQSIGGFIALNDMNGLNEYYKRLLEECKLTNNLNLLNPETINNPSIYSLLTNKYYTAIQKDVNMTFSIFIDLSKINFNMYELSRILGILLDNAIEAAEETDEKKIEIEILSDSKKQKFIIKNSCKDSNISTTKIFEKGYSTKNRDSGLGLWKVHKILSKNTNLDLFTTIKDNVFSQQLEIYY